MKKSIIAVLTAVVLVSSVSCGNKDKSKEVENRLGKMEVVIPEVLQDNPEIVKYIEEMSVVVDEYALLMDDVIQELDFVEGEDWESLSVREQMKLATVGAKFAMKAAPVTAKWGELEAKRALDSDELTEEEQQALLTVLERFEKRMEQIEEKNQEFFGGLES